MRKIPFLCVWVVWPALLHAQVNIADTALGSTAVAYTKNKYDTERGRESAIYNGVQFYPYLQTIEGIPFFSSADWQKGTVVYDDVVYNNILMKYDLVKDQVVITPDEKALYIILFSPRVKEFSFSGFRFVRLGGGNDEHSLAPGFYRQLANGRVSAFSKQTKWIFEQIIDQSIYRRFDQRTRHYLQKDGKYHLIKNAGDLFDVLKEHKKEVQQFLSARGFKYKREPEQTMIAAVEFYNQLEN